MLDPDVSLWPALSLGCTVRMIGIVGALMQLLLQGQRVRPAKGREIGIVDELVSTREELIPAAKKWIEANPEAQQPWDVKGYKIPGGTPSTPSLAMNLPAFPANLRKQIKGANYPAPHHIMAAAVEGAVFEQGLRDERTEAADGAFLDGDQHLVLGGEPQHQIRIQRLGEARV